MTAPSGHQFICAKESHYLFGFCPNQIIESMDLIWHNMRLAQTWAF